MPLFVFLSVPNRRKAKFLDSFCKVFTETSLICAQRKHGINVGRLPPLLFYLK